VENKVLSSLMLFIVVGGVGYGVYALMKTRSDQILSQWAVENGYHILELQPKVFNRGPFFWSTKMQTIHRITVQDTQGMQHSGWVRCGNFLQGVFSDKVEVKWD
jgi:hypothetical protein